MKLLLFCLCLVFPACALLPTKAKFEAKMARWVGSTGDELVASYGAPQSIVPLDGGGKLYQYVDSSREYDSAYNPNTRSVATTETVYGCRAHFITNTKGVITRYGYNGNSCRSY